MFAGKNDIQNEIATRERSHLPNHSETTVTAKFAEEPYSCCVYWSTDKQQEPKQKINVLLTFLIICNRDGKLFPGLQTRIESGRVCTRCGRIHTRIRE
jgi:hypothetical protein